MIYKEYILNKGPLIPSPIYLHYAVIDTSKPWDPDPGELLSEDEISRANRIVRDQDRQKFLFCHTFLRHVLALHARTTPNMIEIQQCAGMKPYLAKPYGHVRFSLSHSGSYCIVGVSQELEIGVDVEVFRPVRHIDKIIERYLDPVTANDLLQLEPGVKSEEFIKEWTLREACVKAVGCGIMGLASIKPVEKIQSGGRKAYRVAFKEKIHPECIVLQAEIENDVAAAVAFVTGSENDVEYLHLPDIRLIRETNMRSLMQG